MCHACNRGFAEKIRLSRLFRLPGGKPGQHHLTAVESCRGHTMSSALHQLTWSAGLLPGGGLPCAELQGPLDSASSSSTSMDTKYSAAWSGLTALLEASKGGSLAQRADRAQLQAATAEACMSLW